MAKKQDLPINKKAEELLLGALLRGPDAYWRIHEKIQAHHFHFDLHKQIFTAIQDICLSSNKLTLTILTTRLPEEDSEGRDMLGHLQVLIANSEETSVDDVADEVAEAAGARQLIQVGNWLIKEGSGKLRAAVDIASEAESKILEVLQASSPIRPKRLSEVVARVATSANRTNASQVLPGFTLGLNALDEIMGLAMAGDFIVIEGAQGDGKSALASQIAEHIAKSSPVLYLSNEMTDEQTAVRRLAARAGISVKSIREGAFDFDGRHKMKVATEAIDPLHFYLLNDPKMTVRRIRSYALWLKRTHGLAALFIDQLTHIKLDSKFRVDRFERAGEITSELKGLMLELGVPGFLLAQRTRTAQRRDDPVPQIDDADAPSIERDADIVLAVWRKYNWLKKRKPPKANVEAESNWQTELFACRNQASVICLKHRADATDEQRDLKWDGATTTFSDI